MFTVKIFKSVWAGDLPGSDGKGIYEDLKYVSEEYPDCVNLEYELKLPFVPYPGLSIVDESDDGVCFRSGEIKAVSWFTDDSLFGCWVADSTPYSSRGYDYTYEWLVDRALKDGWVLVK